MNERIKELVKQSGGIGHDDDGNELAPMLVGQRLEEFAKLVAEECAKLCDLYAMPDGTSETAIILGQAIRYKFGVGNE